MTPAIDGRWSLVGIVSETCLCGARDGDLPFDSEDAAIVPLWFAVACTQNVCAGCGQRRLVALRSINDEPIELLAEKARRFYSELERTGREHGQMPDRG